MDLHSTNSLAVDAVIVCQIGSAGWQILPRASRALDRGAVPVGLDVGRGDGEATGQAARDEQAGHLRRARTSAQLSAFCFIGGSKEDH